MTANSIPPDMDCGEKTSCILLVEDELFVRITIGDSLREAGFAVIEAFNADEAVSILRSGALVDLILSDVRMPGAMDGLDLLEHARGSYPHIPVIVMSGHLMAREALDRGAAHFLAKPYSLKDALDVITGQIATSTDDA